MMVRAFSGYLVIAAAAFSIACGSTQNNNDNGTPGDTTVNRDGTILFDGTVVEDIPVINKLCETDEQCQTEKGGMNWACGKCETEWACVEVGEIGDPTWGCFEDMNCGSERYCEACTKTCKMLLPACTPCEKDTECEGQMSHCVDKVTYKGVETSLPEKVCATWCPLSTSVCAVAGAPQGSYVCGEIGDASNGVCVPATMSCDSTIERCETDEECTQEGFVCYPDMGVCGCKDGLSCELGKACHPITHQCMTGCADDNECGTGTVCSQGLCTPPCTGTLEKQNVTGCTASAPEGMQWDCNETGHCFIPGMCFLPKDCTEAETFCNAETHTCDSGCMFDFDCKSFSLLCDTTTTPGTCIRKPCIGNYQCSCGEVCALEAGECVAAEGKYCEVCDPEADEPCGDKAILCVGFKDQKTEEDLGSYCMPPCSEDKENECPQGWQCQEIKNSDGSTNGRKCVRHCYKKVAGGCAMGDAPDPVVSDTTTAEVADNATVSDP